MPVWHPKVAAAVEWIAPDSIPREMPRDKAQSGQIADFIALRAKYRKEFRSPSSSGRQST
jgi:hypothetical protein